MAACVSASGANVPVRRETTETMNIKAHRMHKLSEIQYDVIVIDPLPVLGSRTMGKGNPLLFESLNICFILSAIPIFSSLLPRLTRAKNYVTGDTHMKLSDLIDTQFKTGLAKLTAASLPLRVAYQLKGLVTSVEAELKKYEDVRQAALKEFGKVKEDGSYEIDEATSAVRFKSEEAAKSFFAQHAELANTEVTTVNKLKLDFELIADKVQGISAEELKKLEVVLDI
jgi:hypothetical protein